MALQQYVCALNCTTKVWDSSSGLKLSKFDSEFDSYKSNQCKLHNLLSCYIFWRYWIDNYNIKKYLNININRIPLLITNIKDSEFNVTFGYIVLDNSNETPNIISKENFDFFKLDGSNNFLQDKYLNVDLIKKEIFNNTDSTNKD